jgi:glutaredoxin-related protein
MADSYGAISPEVDSRKKAILQAVAEGGTKGLQAFEQAEKQIAASKDSAVGRTQALAGLIGGPESKGFDAPIIQQFDTRQADLAQRRAGFSEDMARLGSAGNRALSSMAAIAPLMKARDQRSLADQAKAAAAKDWEARSLGQAELDEQKAAEAAQNAQKAFDENEKAIASIENIAKLRQKDVDSSNDRLGRVVVDLQKKGLWDAKRQRPKVTTGPDYENFQDALESRNYARNALKTTQNSPELKQFLSQRQSRQEALAAAQGASQIPRSDRARRIATDQFGIEQALAMGKLGAEDIPKARQPGSPLTAMQQKAIKSAGLSEQDYAEVQADKDYDAVASFLNQNLAGISKDEVVAYILAKVPAHKKRTRALLRAEFEGQALSAAQLKRLEEG